MFVNEGVGLPYQVGYRAWMDDLLEADVDVFGPAVRATRKERGLSGAALAEKVGISRPYLVQIETGSRRPSSQVRSKLLRALKVSAAQLQVAEAKERRQLAVAAALQHTHETESGHMTTIVVHEGRVVGLLELEPTDSAASGVGERDRGVVDERLKTLARLAASLGPDDLELLLTYCQALMRAGPHDRK